MSDIRNATSSGSGVTDFFNSWSKDNAVSPALQTKRDQVYADQAKSLEEERKRREEEQKRLEKQRKSDANKKTAGDIFGAITNPGQAISKIAGNTDVRNTLIGALIDVAPLPDQLKNTARNVAGVKQVLPVPTQEDIKTVGKTVLNSAASIPASVLQTGENLFKPIGQGSTAVGTSLRKLSAGQNVDFGTEYKNAGNVMPNPVKDIAAATDKQFGTETMKAYEEAVKHPVLNLLNTTSMLALGISPGSAVNLAAKAFFTGEIALGLPGMVNTVINAPDRQDKVTAATQLLLSAGMTYLMWSSTPMTKTDVVDTRTYSVDNPPPENTLTPTIHDVKVQQAWGDALKNMIKSEVDIAVSRKGIPVETSINGEAATGYLQTPEQIASAKNYINVKQTSEGFAVKEFQQNPTLYGSILNWIGEKMGRGNKLTSAESVIVNDVTTNPQNYVPDPQSLQRITSGTQTQQPGGIPPVMPSDLVQHPVAPLINNNVQPTGTNPSDLVGNPVKPLVNNQNTVQPQLQEMDKKQLVEAGFDPEATGYNDYADIEYIDGKPAIAYKFTDRGDISGISVQKDLRRQGIASKFIEEQAGSNGGTIGVQSPNSDMIEVLNKLGVVSEPNSEDVVTLDIKPGAKAPVIEGSKISVGDKVTLEGKTKEIAEVRREGGKYLYKIKGAKQGERVWATENDIKPVKGGQIDPKNFATADEYIKAVRPDGIPILERSKYSDIWRQANPKVNVPTTVRTETPANPERWVYSKPIKVPTDVYRGTSKDTGSGFAMFGQGTYSAASKAEAAKYGKVAKLGADSIPSNPLQFKSSSDFSQWEYEMAKKLGVGKRDLYGLNKGVDDLVGPMGYDGITIGTGKDLIAVKFKPNTSGVKGGVDIAVGDNVKDKWGGTYTVNGIEDGSVNVTGHASGETISIVDTNEDGTPRFTKLEKGAKLSERVKSEVEPYKPKVKPIVKKTVKKPEFKTPKGIKRLRYEEITKDNAEATAERYLAQGKPELASASFRVTEGQKPTSSVVKKAGGHLTKSDLQSLLKNNEEFRLHSVMEVTEDPSKYDNITSKPALQLSFKGKTTSLNIKPEAIGLSQRDIELGDRIGFVDVAKDKGQLPELKYNLSRKIGKVWKIIREPGRTTGPQEVSLRNYAKFDQKLSEEIRDLVLGENRGVEVYHIDRVPAEIRRSVVEGLFTKSGIQKTFRGHFGDAWGMYLHQRNSILNSFITFADKSNSFVYGHEMGHPAFQFLLDRSERGLMAKESGLTDMGMVEEWFGDRLGEAIQDYYSTEDTLKGKLHWSERMISFFRRLIQRIQNFFGKKSEARPIMDKIIKEGLLHDRGEMAPYKYEDIAISKIEPGKPTLQKFEGFTNLTTKTLQRLEGRTEISKQFVEDLLKQQDIKKSEKELFEIVLAEYDGKIPVKEFADKIRTELLPLNPFNLSEANQDYDNATQYERVNLPEHDRVEVQHYEEVIYESPVDNNAGKVHWGNTGTDNYFAHVRREDLTQRADNLKYTSSPEIRQIIELQSDLFQKGRLEGQHGYKYQKLSESLTSEEKTKLQNKAVELEKVFNKNLDYTVEHVLRENLGDTATQIRRNSLLFQDEMIHNFFNSTGGNLFTKIRNVGLSDLEVFNEAKKGFTTPAGNLTRLEPYKNTWQDRIVREEIKRAATDGMKKLRFPTGETAMRVEGMGNGGIWYSGTVDEDAGRMSIDDVRPGTTINDGTGGDNWVITKDLGDGKFRAAPAIAIENDYRVYELAKKFDVLDDGILWPADFMSRLNGAQQQEAVDLVDKLAESFDVSGKIDTQNPIYKFYESEVYNYLRKTRDIERVTDQNGNTWFETKITREDADAPLMAFSRPKKAKTYDYEVDKILDETKTKDRILTRIGDSITNFRQELYNQYLPMAQAEATLRKEAGLPKAKLPLDKRFELIAGADGKAEIDVDDMVERVIKPLNPKEYKDTQRIATLRRIVDRLTKDAERKKVGEWTVEKAQTELSQIESSMSQVSLDKINKSLDSYQTVMDKALMLQVQSGRMKQEVYDAIKAENDFYAPFKVMKWYQENGANMSGPGGKVATSQDFAKRISGISEDDFQIQDIFETSAENLLKSRVLAEKNLAMLDLAELLKIDAEGQFVKKARPRRSFPVNFSTAEDILKQLSLQHQPLEQSFIKVGKAIEFADELGIELKRKNLPVNLGNATLGTAPGGTVNLRAFTSETTAHELAHIFDTTTEKTGVAFGREYAKRLSALVREPGMRKEMNDIINYRKADAPTKWKSKSTEKFAEFVQIYIHDPKVARELAPTFTDRFETEILPNEQIQGLIEALSNFYHKVDGLPNIMTRLEELDNNYLELAIRRAFPDRNPVFASIPESKPQPGFDVVNYIKDGVDQAMEVSSNIALALNGKQAHDGLLLKMMRLARVPFRTAVIPLNMAFQIVNPFFTDIPRLAIMSEFGLRPSDVARFVPDFLYSFYTSLAGNFGHPNELYKSYLSSGGANSTFSYGINPDAFRPKIKKLTLGQRIKPQLNPINFAKTVINDISKFSNVMEELTKIMGYKRGLRFKGIGKLAKEIVQMKEDGVDPKLIQLKMDEFNLEHNALASEIRNFSGSPDFAKMGLSGQDINLVFMFFRTKLNEAVSDIGRFAGREGGAKAGKAWLRATLFVALPSLYLALLNNDKDHKKDYDSLSQSEKDNYFVIFRDTYFTDANGNRAREALRIPKRAFVKTIANAIEDAIVFANDKTPENAASFAFDLIANQAPINISGANPSEVLESILGSTNPLIKAPMEYATGRNTFFHSNTVPDRMKYVSAELQYKESTPEFFKVMGKILGESPLKLQQLADSLGAQAFTQFKVKPTPDDRAKWTGLPVINKFVRSSTVSEDETTNNVIKKMLQDKADEKQLNTSGTSSLSYQASLMLQLNAEEKQLVYGSMNGDDAAALEQELTDYYAASAAKRSTGTAVKSTGVKKLSTSTGKRKAAKTVSLSSSGIKPYKTKTYKVKKLTAATLKVKPLKIKRYKVKSLKV